MFSSLALELAFTVAFTATGLRSLVRLLGPVPVGGRLGEASHLLMSGAMVGMTWGLTGGPDSPGGTAQLVVFWLLALAFGVRVLDPGERPRIGDAHHLLMLGAMVWMVAGTPTSHGEHDHGAAPGWWTPAITVAFVVLLCGAALAPVTAPRPAGSGARPRLDLAGHLLMSGGMAAMLVAML
jgi:uncharacterized protein DUF5134